MVGLKICANLHYQIHINKLPKRISSHQNAYQAAQMHIKPLRIVINSDPPMLASGQFHFTNLHASDPHVLANFAFIPLRSVTFPLFPLRSFIYSPCRLIKASSAFTDSGIKSCSTSHARTFSQDAISCRPNI